MKACWLLFAVAAPAWTQPKAVDLFGHVGVFRGGSDEGSLGRAASYGGALTVPLPGGGAIDFDVQSARLTRTWAPSGFWQSRRTLLSPSLLYRKGAEAAYFFAGGGVGGEIATGVSREGNLVEGYTLPPPWREISPGLFEATFRDFRRTIHVRVGLVGAATRRLPVRVEFFIANWHLGFRIGLGYRFKR